MKTSDFTTGTNNGDNLLNNKSEDKSICPHGLHWFKCKDEQCMTELLEAEEAATCQHGFLVGCKACNSADV